MIEYDFTAEPGPFQTLDLPGQGPYGVWESGVGWRATATKVQVCNQIARYCLTIGIPVNSYLLDVQVYGTLSSGYITDGGDCDSVIINHVGLNLPGPEGLPEDSKWVDDLVLVYNSTNIRTTMTSVRIWGCGTNTLEDL